MYLLLITFIVLALVLMITAISDIIRLKHDKRLIFLIILFPVLGSIIYFQVIRPSIKNRVNRNVFLTSNR